jgi:hypothetical protein
VQSISETQTIRQPYPVPATDCISRLAAYAVSVPLQRLRSGEGDQKALPTINMNPFELFEEDQSRDIVSFEENQPGPYGSVPFEEDQLFLYILISFECSKGTKVFVLRGV